MTLRFAAVLSALVIPALLSSCGDGGQTSNGDATTSRPASGTGDPSKDTAIMDPAVASIQEFIDANVDITKASWKTNLKPPPKASFTADKSYFWELQTSKGPIKIKLMPEVAPEHVTNTIFLVRSGFYDGLKFHRVIQGFMAQGGCPLGLGNGSPGFSYGSECSPAVKHDRPGLLSMANTGQPNSDGSQFFLTFVPTPHLDGKHTIFGEVVEGMDAVKALEAAGSRGGQTRETLLMETSTITVE